MLSPWKGKQPGLLGLSRREQAWSQAGLGLSTGAEGSTERFVPAGETVPTRFHARNLQSGCAGYWGADPADPGDCQPPAPAEPTSLCPALRPFQQMGSSVQMLSLGSQLSLSGVMVGVSFLPVRLDIFSV